MANGMRYRSFVEIPFAAKLRPLLESEGIRGSKINFAPRTHISF